MVTIIDITTEYSRKHNTNIGSIMFENNYDYDSHQEEIETAKWLVSSFGGNIVLLKESTKQKEEKPDYLWDNKYWERKGINSSKFNTIDIRIRKAFSQINEKKGGLILDFKNSDLTIEQAKRKVISCASKRFRGNVEIIIKKNQNYIVLNIIKK